MANSNAPSGLTPGRYRNGAPWNGVARTYYVPASDSTALFIGDPVIIAGSGDTDGVPTVTRATAGSAGRITGVVVGFRPTAPFPAKYRAASTAMYVLVADDPALLFEAQEDSAGGALAATNIGQNIDLVSGSGDTNTGLSGFMIDSSTAATTATLQMRIVGLAQRTDNVIGNYAKWLVAINLPTETGAAGSTGI